MGPLDQLLETHPIPTWRKFAWVIMFLLAGGVGWSFFATLDEVTIAEGTVVPKGDLKVVQHLEGGIISVINVREGAVVKEGEVLVQLDVRSSGLKKEEIEVSLDRQLALKARLEAEAAGTEPKWPEIVIKRRASFVQDQRRTFKDRQTELQSTLRVTDQQIKQKELAVTELKTKQKSTIRNLGLAKQRLADSADLLAQQLVPKVEHLKLEAEVEDLESEKAQMVSTIPRTQAEVNEAKERRTETLDRFRREAQEQLGEVGETVAKLDEELKAASERGARLDIKSPIDGTVKNMRYSTIGGVVKGGEPIMEIVPSNAQLIIDAKLNPTDIGFVAKGDPARVKVSTYDFVRYGALDGKVTLIAADATEGEGDEEPYFQIQVETDKSYLGKVAGQNEITAGMQATVDIHTGKRTVIDFLIRPVLKTARNFGRER